MKTAQDILVNCIQAVLARLDWESYARDIYLDIPENSLYGELSSNIALRLSKPLNKPPLQIANTIISEIKNELKSSHLAARIKDIKAQGAGFINFHFTDTYFYEELAHLISKGQGFLRDDFGGGKSVLIEFVSANPTGSLSVAHARQAAVGDALANILEFLGFKVKREYYLNDEGNQIDILGQSVELRRRELSGETIDFPENYYQGDYIYDIAREVEEGVIASREAAKQSQEIASSATSWPPRNDKTKLEDIAEFAAAHILELIKKELDDFGVRFDYWYSQKELRKSGKINETFDSLKKKGLLYEQDSALWFKSTEFGDDKDRVVIKSDGSYTYLAPDIAYHEEKYRRGFSWLINLWGPDHHGYISRLKAAVEALGHSPETLSIIIVQLATIFRQGKPIQMSTRKGQYITLREVLDEVGRDASRYLFLMRRTSSHLDFDLDIAKKQTPENPVYYVQYAYARICSILRLSQIEINKVSLDLSVLKEKEELDLIKKSLQFTNILNACLHSRDPYMLTVYLQELAETFHKFYDRYRVLGQADTLTQARLGLIEATRIVIGTGLGLLGVSKSEKM